MCSILNYTELKRQQFTSQNIEFQVEAKYCLKYKFILSS